MVAKRRRNSMGRAGEEANLELQVAALMLWQQYGTQTRAALNLQALYPEAGSIDGPRISHLVDHAIQNGLADRPETVPRLRESSATVRELRQKVGAAEQFPSLVTPLAKGLATFCSRTAAAQMPHLLIVGGSIDPGPDGETSEYTKNAARRALAYVRQWAQENRLSVVKVGLSWGQQLHYLAKEAIKIGREVSSEVQYITTVRSFPNEPFRSV